MLYLCNAVIEKDDFSAAVIGCGCVFVMGVCRCGERVRDQGEGVDVGKLEWVRCAGGA